MSKTTAKQAIDGFLLNCEVKGISCVTIWCYSIRIKGFRWYVIDYDYPDITDLAI